MFGAVEKWGRENPVALAIFSLFVGFVPLGGLASVGAYNVGFYAGTTTSESYWRSTFDQKLNEGINSQLAAKCGQAVSEVNATCQQDAKRFERSIKDREKTIAELNAQIESFRRRSDIVDLYDRLVDSAQSILKSLLAARERRDFVEERNLKSRFYSLLLDIRRLNQLYVEWGALFNGRATELTQRYSDSQSIPTEQIIRYLEAFAADIDLRKKVIQREVDEANRIKSKKY